MAAQDGPQCTELQVDGLGRRSLVQSMTLVAGDVICTDVAQQQTAQPGQKMTQVRLFDLDALQGEARSFQVQPLWGDDGEQARSSPSS